MTDDDAGRHDRHRDGRPAAAASAGPKPRVFYDVGYIDTTGQIYGPATGSFLAEMLDHARGRRHHRRRRRPTRSRSRRSSSATRR